ncbi:lichenicidin A2 family type 2 lantibiotic [Priestia megaterium]|uniref:lichenicidin A2 family type 2 lantibiotic n=1 Tax=Priestia megaterium TaxID=1404 RepID=UPI00256FA992|nr:mersacidin family lantibiotic [Priestia megaterium]WJD83661.1 mersacidin family lantibiotic [Priestia megaterium]
MTDRQLIEAWKNPELRANLVVKHPSGQAFAELSTDEMLSIQGAANLQGEPIPTIASSAVCVEILTVTTVVTSIKRC